MRILTAICVVILTTSLPAQKVTKKHGRQMVAYGPSHAIGKVKHHQKQGLWKYYDVGDHLYMTKEFVDDKENGMCIEYFFGGKIAKQGRYVDGVKEGIWESFYDNGSKQSRAIYLHDTLNGEYFEWYNNGQMAVHSNRLLGKYTYNWTWNTNGKPLEIQYYTNGLKSGTWRSYPFQPLNGDTCAVVVAEYALGELNGKWQRFARCRLEDEMMYRNGKLNGLSIRYDINGAIQHEEEYRDGLQNGKACLYKNGKLVRKGTWVNGKQTGPLDEWDIYGRKLSHAYYTRNDIDTMITYFPSGKVASTRYYRRESGIAGMIEYSDYVVYDTSGVKIQSGKYRSNIQIDQWNTFYPNGKVWSEEHYKNGVLDGSYKRWYQNGKLMIDAMINNGQLVDGAKVWNDKGVLQKKGSATYNEILEGNLSGEILSSVQNSHHDRPADPDIMEGDENEPPTTDILEEPKEEVFTYAETMPQFPGGQDSLNIYLQRNIRYPHNVDLPKEGIVYVGFVVQKDGSVTKVTIKRGVKGAPALDQEAMRVVAGMPKWSPGLMNGRPVAVDMIIPVRFRAESSGN